jgi:aryl-alcohol dehydrogenase-like predicted oxidoreductase
MQSVGCAKRGVRQAHEKMFGTTMDLAAQLHALARSIVDVRNEGALALPSSRVTGRRVGVVSCVGRCDRRRDRPREVAMRYRPFGKTGLEVSVVGFGCWPMAGDRYGAIEDDEAIKAIHRALERGVNCVDTAPAYGGGHSEEVVGRALAGRRRDVILVTKCGVKVPPPGQLGPLRDASRANILREIDASLRRLHTDWVDVLLVHWPDSGTPFDETMRALDEIVASGRARFVGLSNFTEAMMAECMRARRVDVIQVGYHMFDRRQETETFPYCLAHGIGVMGYGSLGHGLLTGAFTAGTTFDPGRDWRGNGVAFGQPIFRGENFRKNVAVVERLRREVAEPRGVPVSQIALAWVLGHPAVSTALVGARTPAEVDANDAGADLELSGAERAAIDTIISDVAGRVREFTPLRPAMEAWGDEIPASSPV